MAQVHVTMASKFQFFYTLFALIFLGLVENTTVMAAPHVYKRVSSYQVLQRDPITNTATVLLNGAQKKTYKTGGPYTIGEATQVYVGDVWVMAGQSNMRGHGYYKDPFTGRNLTPSPIAGVHLFDSSENWTLAQDPTHTLWRSPRSVHRIIPDPTVSNSKVRPYRGASLGLSFAAKYRELNNKVPVGLVASAHGGVTLEQWKRPTQLNSTTEDTTLYGAMMARIAKVEQISGVLWFQGESDATAGVATAATYQERFAEWIDVLRRDLKRPELPFAFVQLASHRIDVPESMQAWMIVQDAQRKIMSGSSPYTAGVAALDCRLDDRVHVSAVGLQTIGKRLAVAATDAKQGNANRSTPLPKKAIYQESLSSQAPGLISILVQFDMAEGDDWKNKIDEELFGFELETEDKKAVILSARISSAKDKSVRLFLISTPKSPVSVSYGMNQAKVNLVTSRGMAVPAFRGLVVE
jgi:lysophospholipase L1-like esterase